MRPALEQRGRPSIPGGQVFRASAMMAGASIFGRLGWLAVSVLAAIVMAPSDFGTLALAQAICYATGAAAGFGLPRTLAVHATRFNRHSGDLPARRLLYAASACGVGSAALLEGVPLVPSGLTNVSVWSLILWSAGCAIFGLAQGGLLGLHRHAAAAASAVTRSVAAIAGTVIAIVSAQVGTGIAFAGLLELLNALAWGFYFWRCLGSSAIVDDVRMIEGFVPSALAGWVSDCSWQFAALAPLYATFAFMSAGDAGAIALGMRLLAATQLVPSQVAAATLPLLATAAQTNAVDDFRSTYRSGAKLILGTTALPVVAVILGLFVGAALLPDEYNESRFVIIAIVSAAMPQAWNLYLGALLQVKRRLWAWMVGDAFMAACRVGGPFLLFGVCGPWATAISLWLGAVVRIAVAQRAALSTVTRSAR